MAHKTMSCKASDHEYLHKDFHGALSAGIEYLHTHYGEQAVRDYLREFTRKYYAPLRRAIRQRGLAALKVHFETMYTRERARFRVRLTRDELVISVAACPAITHMKSHGYPVARLFHETTRTVNEALCEGTPFKAELAEYDPETGRSVQRFFRRSR
jgi:hypothetical protein